MQRTGRPRRSGDIHNPPLWISGLWRNASLLNKLPVRLIQADHRAQRIIRTLIYIQNVLHPRYKLRPGLWNAPFLFCQGVPFPVSWTVKMKKKQKETQDILSYHTQAAGCSDKARAKASGGRQPIEECGRTGL